MSLSIYDSPTFLDQKDKYLMGLSLPQLMAVVGVAFTLFLFSMALPFGMIIKLSTVGVGTCVISVVMFVRLSGLSIPGYVVASVMAMIRKPVYEEHQILLLNGGLAWLESNSKKIRGGGGSEGSGKSFFSFIPFLGKSKIVSDEMAMKAVASELQAELDNKMVQGAVAADQFVRDGVKVLFKGG